MLEKMRFVASPTNSELADLYRGATMTCCASSFEGFGLSVLESMACGISVACSDMRSLREVADDAAVYFSHDDEEAMGEAIAGLLEDAEYRRQLKYRGITAGEAVHVVNGGGADPGIPEKSGGSCLRGGIRAGWRSIWPPGTRGNFARRRG